uniref:Uncharacterized protein n=1 Tax=Chenopodium quinoa TaxID=63459 RepID=A0A803LF11_CHEQI
MRVTLFGDQIKAYDEAIAYNGEYEISNATVKPLEDHYRTIHDQLPFQLNFNHRTVVQPVCPETGYVIPQYRSIASIPKVEVADERYAFALSTTMPTRIIHNPKGDRANVLREWVVAQKQLLQDRQAKAANALMEERHWIQAIIPNATLDDVFVYTGCSGCGKKCSVPEGRQFTCIVCDNKNCVSTPRILEWSLKNIDAEDASKKDLTKLSVARSDDIEFSDLNMNVDFTPNNRHGSALQLEKQAPQTFNYTYTSPVKTPKISPTEWTQLCRTRITGNKQSLVTPAHSEDTQTNLVCVQGLARKKLYFTASPSQENEDHESTNKDLANLATSASNKSVTPEFDANTFVHVNDHMTQASLDSLTQVDLAAIGPFAKCHVLLRQQLEYDMRIRWAKAEPPSKLDPGPLLDHDKWERRLKERFPNHVGLWKPMELLKQILHEDLENLDREDRVGCPYLRGLIHETHSNYAEKPYTGLDEYDNPKQIVLQWDPGRPTHAVVLVGIYEAGADNPYELEPDTYWIYQNSPPKKPPTMNPEKPSLLGDGLNILHQRVVIDELYNSATFPPSVLAPSDEIEKLQRRHNTIHQRRREEKEVYLAHRGPQ